jgi:hypothetical protein
VTRPSGRVVRVPAAIIVPRWIGWDIARVARFPEVARVARFGGVALGGASNARLTPVLGAGVTGGVARAGLV